MGIPAGVGRIVLGGHMATSEIFETGWWVTEDLPDNSACLDLATAVKTEFEDGSAPILAVLGAAGGYDTVTVYGYPAGGPAAGSSASVDLTGQGGQGSAPYLPLQVSLVATLLTGEAGRSKRGRMYFPATRLTVDLNGHCGDVTAFAGAVATILGNVFTGFGSQAVVVSQKNTSTTPITSVRVDNRPDIQRRRAEGLAASQTITADL